MSDKADTAVHEDDELKQPQQTASLTPDDEGISSSDDKAVTDPQTAAPPAGKAAAPTAVSRDELTELVRAITFSKPDASMRAVHREITQELSQKENFEFLKEVPLNEVKKVWKKATNSGSASAATTTATAKLTGAAAMLDISEAEQSATGVVKLYTVGDGTVRTLAREYSQAAAAAAVPASPDLQHYVSVFLDVPADRSGARPHQALINFNQGKTKGGTNSSSNKKKKKKASQPPPPQEQDPEHERGHVVKIQMAAAADTNEKFPMLLYNQDRTQKTFIHPDPQDDGYERIQEWISKQGVGGALGTLGGTKAYFYSRTTKQKPGPDVLSIDVSGLAPAQPW